MRCHLGPPWWYKPSEISLSVRSARSGVRVSTVEAPNPPPSHPRLHPVPGWAHMCQYTHPGSNTNFYPHPCKQISLATPLIQKCTHWLGDPLTLQMHQVGKSLCRPRKPVWDHSDRGFQGPMDSIQMFMSPSPQAPHSKGKNTAGGDPERGPLKCRAHKRVPGCLSLELC